LVVLKNNYWAWMLEGMEEHGDFKTEYDEDVSDSTGTLVEYLLQGACIDILQGSSETSYVEIPTQIPRPEVVEQEDNNNNGRSRVEDEAEEHTLASYTKALRRFQEWEIEKVRNNIRRSANFERVRIAQSAIRGMTEEREKKRRKIVKELKEYTGGRRGPEKAFQGWSKRAYKDMSIHKKGIESDSDLYIKFDKAYRSIHARQQVGKSSTTETAGSTDNRGGGLGGSL
jgi:hypothetical protein